MTEQSTIRGFQSVRTILEAIIVALLLWTGRSMVTLQTQVAVVQSDVATIRGQLADVPAMTRQMAELQVQVKRNAADIDELRKLRGIK